MNQSVMMWLAGGFRKLLADANSGAFWPTQRWLQWADAVSGGTFDGVDLEIVGVVHEASIMRYDIDDAEYGGEG